MPLVNSFQWINAILIIDINFHFRLILIVKNSSSSGFTTQHIRFQQFAYDASGERIAAGDHHGNIYILNILKNR